MSEKITLEGFNGILHVKYGKKEFLAFNLISSIAKHLQLSKSEVKRVIKQGGLDIQVEVENENK